MFKKDKNVRRLSKKEIIQFENDGYLTGLPVFDKSTSDRRRALPLNK